MLHLLFAEVATPSSNDLFFKIAAFVSPLLTGLITVLITYRLTIKGKKFDLLYQSKVPAINEIIMALVNFKKDSYGAIAREEGNEFSPFYESQNSSFEHRGIIAGKLELYSALLSKDSNQKLDDFIGKMSFLCNAEISMEDNPDIRYAKMYEGAIKEADKIIEQLNKDLNLK